MNSGRSWSGLAVGVLVVLSCGQIQTKPRAKAEGRPLPHVQFEQEPEAAKEQGPEAAKEPAPEAAKEQEPETAKEPEKVPEPRQMPKPSVHAPMLAAHTGIPIVVRSELVQDAHTYVVYSYNTLDALLAGMKPGARTKATKTLATGTFPATTPRWSIRSAGTPSGANGVSQSTCLSRKVFLRMTSRPNPPVHAKFRRRRLAGV